MTRVRESFWLRIWQDRLAHRRAALNEIGAVADRAWATPTREVAPMATITQEQGNATMLAMDILDRQLKAGEARVDWASRDESRRRRIETAGIILTAVAERGDLNAYDAILQACEMHLPEGTAAAVTVHAYSALTADGTREFRPGSGLRTWGVGVPDGDGHEPAVMTEALPRKRTLAERFRGVFRR